MPSEPSGSIRQDSSIQNSFSSHTSPGLTCRVSVMVSPSRSRAARSTGWRKPDPLAVVLLVGVGVVPLGAVAHRQHVVGEVGRLVPGRGERDEAADLGLVGEDFHPRQPVGVGPHRVVDADEVGVELAAALGEEVRQQERHLVLRQRVLQRPGQVLPDAGVRAGCGSAAARTCSSAFGNVPPSVATAPSSAEMRNRVRDTCHPPRLPGGRRAPGVAGEPGAGARDDLGDLGKHAGVDPRFGGREVEGELRVEHGEHLLERLERDRPAGEAGLQVLSPVPPPADEVPVIAPGRR